MTRFFVLHLTENDLKGRGLSSAGKAFEVQLLDAEGRAKSAGYVGPDDTNLEIEGQSIPLAVLEAARRQPLGQGEFVDDNGNTVQPF